MSTSPIFTLYICRLFAKSSFVWKPVFTCSCVTACKRWDFVCYQRWQQNASMYITRPLIELIIGKKNFLDISTHVLVERFLHQMAIHFWICNRISLETWVPPTLTLWTWNLYKEQKSTVQANFEETWRLIPLLEFLLRSRF